MAVLEKIREKKALTTIVIGGALLMFILTMNAGSNSGGCTGQDMTLAEVNGNKIEYEQFSKLSQVQNVLNKNNQNDVSADELNEQMLSRLVLNSIIDQECEDAAITAGDNEISAMMGITLKQDNTPYQLSSAIQSLMGYMSSNFGAQVIPAQIKEIAEKGTIQGQKVDASMLPEIKALWQNAIEETEAEIKINKVGWLVQNCMMPNDFDREQVQNGMSTQFAVEYAQVPYTGDDKYKATDAEIKAEYEKLKEMFRIDNEMRAVHMIVVPVNPSDKDLAEADKLLNKAVKELGDSTSRGFDALRNYDNFVQSTQNYYTSDGVLQSQPQNDALVMALRTLSNDSIGRGVLAGNVGGVAMTQRMGSTANVYKLIDRFTVADSIKLDVIQVMGNKQYQDSVLALLNGGANADSLATKLGEKKFAVTHVPQYLRGYEIPDSLRAKVGATSDYFVMNNSNEGAVIWKVVEAKAPVTFNEMGVAQYNFIASDLTSGKTQNELQKLLNNYKKAADLEKAFADGKDAQVKKYQEFYNEDVIASTQPTLGGVNKTRSVVKWVFNEAKKGDISQIMNISVDNYHSVLVVAMLDDIYNDYLPATAPEVKNLLDQRVRARKEGEAIVKGNKTNDVNAFASKAGVEVQADTISFLGRAGNLASEPKVVGFVAGAKKGSSSQIVGNSSVVVVKVGDMIESKMAAMPKQMLTQQAMGNLGLNLYQAVMHSRKVKMNPSKFF